MMPALIKKFSRKKGKLIHFPIAALPSIIEEDVSLHSWKRKAAKLHFLDQELDQINQKISRLQSTSPPEYAPQGRAASELEKSIVEKQSEKKSPLIIKAHHDYTAVNPQINAVNDILDRLEQTTLETGKMIKVSPVIETTTEKEEVNFNYHLDNTLLLRLQSAMLELQQKWEETQQRLQTIKSAPPEVKESLSRIDEELSQLRAIAGAPKAKIVTVPPPEQKLKPSWKKKWQAQKLELKAQQKTQQMLDKISSQPKPYQEKLDFIDDQLSHLKRAPQQSIKCVTIAPETGHSLVSPQLKKKARQEVQKIVKNINTENKKKELSAIDKELSTLQETETESVNVVTAAPIIIHQLPPPPKIKKRARKEIKKIIQTINQEKKTEELASINAELSQLDRFQPQSGKIITIAAAEGHHLIAPEIKKKAKKEIKQILQEINQTQQSNQALSKIDAELSELDLPVAEGKIITAIKPMKEKSGLKKKFHKIKEKIVAITNPKPKEAAVNNCSTKRPLPKNKHHRKSRQDHLEELANVDRMLHKITQELAEEES